MVEKVFAYVVRTKEDEARDLLIFREIVPDFPVWQVPKGTVEVGENRETAVLRELHEESGIAAARIVRKLGEREVSVRGGAEGLGEWETQRHHAYEIEPLSILPDTWDHLVAGEGIDNGMVFRFFWQPLTSSLETSLCEGCNAFISALLVRE